MRKRLLVQGWRHVPHSYALVAQAHCLCLLDRADIDLRFADLPYFSPDWRRVVGLFSSEQEQALTALREPEPTFAPEATFRVWPECPDFSAPREGRKYVFATAEYRVLLREHLGGVLTGSEVPDSVDVITPSRWSALAFERFGLPPERIHVVPHGIDPVDHRQDEQNRMATRQRLGVGTDFLYVSAGAMTWNKGLDLLLAAFARVLERQPTARLLLKGVDALYPSKSYVAEVLNSLPAAARNAIADRLIYIGGTFSTARMADLLRAGDCYVSPYRAEGFNMPVLEAAACGVAVICTGGGPTDEFSEAASTWRIRSTTEPMRLTDSETGAVLAPDLDHLIELMRGAADDPPRARAFGARAARHAHDHFSWTKVTELLLARLFPAH